MPASSHELLGCEGFTLGKKLNPSVNHFMFAEFAEFSALAARGLSVLLICALCRKDHDQMVLG